MNLRDADWLDVSSPPSFRGGMQRAGDQPSAEPSHDASMGVPRRSGDVPLHGEPLSRRRKVVALAVVIVVLGVVGWGLVSLGTQEDPANKLPRATPATTAVPVGSAGSAEGAGAGGEAKVVVALSGRVKKPGLYELREGARLADLLEQAGGVETDADLRDLNLAQKLPDEANVYVPRVGEEPRSVPGGLSAQEAAGTSGGGGGSGSKAKINLNTADEKALEELPGVGPATAKAIVAHRTKQGRFRSVKDLLSVKGIGDAKLEALRDYATV